MSHRTAMMLSLVLAVVFALGVVAIARPQLLGREAPATAPPTVAIATQATSGGASAPTPRIIEIPASFSQRAVATTTLDHENRDATGDHNNHEHNESNPSQEQDGD